MSKVAQTGARLALLLCGMAGLALLATATPAFAQQSDLDRQVREIALGLRCPVCQNLSVADSPSPLAGEMRAVIRRKLEAGESREQITQYFVQNYGEGILLDPPRQGFTLLLWLGAALALVVGGLLMVARLRSALAGKGQTALDASAFPGSAGASEGPALPAGRRAQYEAALDAELARYKSGVP